MIEREEKLIKDLFQLWEDLAETGELTINKNFNDSYKSIKERVDEVVNIPEHATGHGNSNHLRWIHNRMIEVYGEDRDVDFLHKFRDIIHFVRSQETAFMDYLEFTENKRKNG